MTSGIQTNSQGPGNVVVGIQNQASSSIGAQTQYIKPGDEAWTTLTNNVERALKETTDLQKDLKEQKGILYVAFVVLLFMVAFYALQAGYQLITTYESLIERIDKVETKLDNQTPPNILVTPGRKAN